MHGSGCAVLAEVLCMNRDEEESERQRNAPRNGRHSLPDETTPCLLSPRSYHD
jgi:hypothetical protein